MLIVNKKLIEKLRAKDEIAFEQVYYEYEKLVYYICYSITKDPHASEDLTQDTFLKLLTSLDNYNETGKFKQYIMMIARNLSKNYVTRVANKQTIYSDEESAREKGVIIEEINMSEDSPDDVCFDLSAKSYFGDGGYGQTVLGPSENVKSFTQSDIINYLNDYYVAENIVTLDVADALTQKYVLPYIRGGSVAKTPEHNLKSLKSRLCAEKDIEQVHFCLTFPSKSYIDDEKVKSEIAISILGGGMSSRLFTKIREELGLAYSVYSYASRYKDVGTCGIYAGVNSSNYQNAYESVIDVVKEFKKGVKDSEIEKVKNQIKASTVFAFERPQTKVQIFSKHYLMTRTLYNPSQRLKAIEKVKKSDIDEVLNDFDFDKMSSAIVGKKVKPLN